MEVGGLFISRVTHAHYILHLEIPKIKGMRYRYYAGIFLLIPLAAACASLNLPVVPKLTVVVVGKRHHGKHALGLFT